MYTFLKEMFMKNIKIIGIITMLMAMLLISACGMQEPQTDLSNPEAAEAQPTAIEQPPEATTDQTVEANWVIEIDDTQQITDDEGLIWKYHLTMYASKAGGEDVSGNYTGEMVLTMEPDFDSAKALAEREGVELLAMLFKHHSEAENVFFEVKEYSQDAYAESMKETVPDNPLLQLGIPDSTADNFAVTRVTFNATQEPINMSLKDEDGGFSGTVPGRKVTVNVPMEITIEGATACCYIYETVHPLERAFLGVITGDVN
jgi:hypothetical protein